MGEKVAGGRSGSGKDGGPWGMHWANGTEVFLLSSKIARAKASTGRNSDRGASRGGKARGMYRRME